MADASETVVVDASVALKWKVQEDDSDAARRLLDDHRSGLVTFLAPSLFDYEVANALRSAVVKGRLTAREASITASAYRDLSIERIDFLEYADRTMEIAFQFERSVYDSAYLALAEARQVSFYTGDRRLYNSVSASLEWVKWIGDYTSLQDGNRRV